MTLAELAKAAFDEQDRDCQWTRLQLALNTYQGRSYGYQPQHRPLLGVVEELGEYNEARSQEDRDDAQADASIFLIQYCTSWRLDAGVLVKANSELDPMVALGRVAHVQLKHEQRIRQLGDKSAAREALAEPLAAVFEGLRDGRSLERYLELVTRVADEVTSRVPANLPKVER